MTYQVRNGDTLSEIAEQVQRLGDAADDLEPACGSRRRCKAGQKLVVYVDPRRVNGG